MTDPISEAETFDIFEYQSGVSYPSDTVTVYLDQRSAYEAQKIEEQIADTKDQDEVDRLVARKEELVEKIKSTALTFHLQGLPPEEAQALDETIRINSEHFEAAQEAGLQGLLSREAFQDEKFNMRLAKHLQYISRINPETGKVQEDRREWTPEIVDRIIKRLAVEERLKIINTMLDLSYRADLYTSLGSDPDFS